MRRSISQLEVMILLSAPSDEEMQSEQKHKEMAEKYERAQAARNPSERARLLKEAAASSARVWDEDARTRRRGSQIGLGTGCVVILFSFVLLLLTFVGRKATLV